MSFKLLIQTQGMPLPTRSEWGPNGVKSFQADRELSNFLKKNIKTSSNILVDTVYLDHQIHNEGEFDGQIQTLS